jgi:alpha-beta hydrolase superfamily lysophospholipase
MEEIRKRCSRLQDEAWLAYLDTLVFDLVRPSRISTPMIVMGGADDTMVLPSEVAATARAYNVKPTIIAGLAHDMMLDIGWRRAAAAVARELDARFAAEDRRLEICSNAA